MHVAQALGPGTYFGKYSGISLSYIMYSFGRKHANTMQSTLSALPSRRSHAEIVDRATLVASSSGYPKMPVEMQQKAMLRSPWRSTSSMHVL